MTTSWQHRAVTSFESLSAALELNAGKSTRSEDLEDYTDYMADPIGLESIAGNANSVIFGRQRRRQDSRVRRSG